MKGTNMRVKSSALIVSFAMAACGLAHAQPDTGRSERTFASPDAAAQALIEAASNNDTAELGAILGSHAKGMLTAGDAARDQAERKEFARLASMRHRLEPSSMEKGVMILIVGDEGWPFPVPIVQVDQRWRFDPTLGSLEIRARRVGANELDVIEICTGYVEAQKAYAAEHGSGAATMEYAKAIRNGLYKPSASRELVPERFAEAAVDGPGARPKPYHGYYFRVLTAQGPNAPGGAHNYLAGKYMIGGFGLIAWPAEYGVTGVHTFIVNQDGEVYEKDLGAMTATAAAAITKYDPDSSWQAVD